LVTLPIAAQLDTLAAEIADFAKHKSEEDIAAATEEMATSEQADDFPDLKILHAGIVRDGESKKDHVDKRLLGRDLGHCFGSPSAQENDEAGQNANACVHGRKNGDFGTNVEKISSRPVAS